MSKFIIQTIFLIFIIGGLIYLYNQKEDNEDYLLLKLIGFYLLGAFSFNLNLSGFIFVLPLGFFIYLLFFKTKDRFNSDIKRNAAILGVVLLYGGLLVSNIYEKVEFRDRFIKTSSITLNNLIDNQEILNDKFNISKDAQLNDFYVEYLNNEDRTINQLSYNILDTSNNKIYSISMFDNNNYYVNIHKLKEENINISWGNGSTHIQISNFLDLVDKVKEKESASANFFTLRYDGKQNIYYSKSQANLYTLDSIDSLFKEVPTGMLIESNSSLVHTPFGGGNDYANSNVYLINYNATQDPEGYDKDKYNGVTYTIENTTQDKKVIVEDHESVYKISKLLESINWIASEVDPTDIPNLILEDNNGNKYSFSEESKGYVYRSMNGSDIKWYIAPYTIYDDINFYTLE